MSPIVAALIALGALLLGYRFYSRYLAQRLFDLRADEEVPSVTLRDDVDYCPTKKGVLWGHHFSSIAGAAPILGPAMAIVFGWGPALLWIVVGVVFMGAAHDFGALVLSIRHAGRSVGDLTERFIGPRSRILFLLIIFFLIWLVGAVFAFAIARLFTGFPASILPVNIEIAIAMAIGWWSFKRGRSLLVPSIVVLVLGYALIVGTSTGHLWVPAEDSLFRSVDFWLVGLMVYAYVASSLPVWLLLQPRDLINSHKLLLGLAALYVGFLLSGAEFAAPLVGKVHELPSIFPILMVTIACGAISGFHGLVSSGTTSKQLACATDARPIGYGAMLCEAGLAILATMAVAAGRWQGVEHASAWHFVAEKSGGGTHLPAVGDALSAFINGSAGFLGELGVPASIGATIVAVLVISFAATSLDTALRIQRMVLAEVGRTYRVGPLENRWIAGAIASGSVIALIYADKDSGAKSLWPVFGATNQVLAGFTLLICALYLRALGKRTLAYSVPALFIMVVTFSAMGLQVLHDLRAEKWLVGIVGALIAVLSAWVALEGALAWRRGPVANRDAQSP